MTKRQSLSTCSHLVKIGRPLPFSVCDSTGRLLLAKGQTISSSEQLNALIARGALVENLDAREGQAAELEGKGKDISALWDSAIDQMPRVLKAAVPGFDFVDSVDGAANAIFGLVSKSPEMAMFQVVRQGESISNYASKHSAHTAIAAILAAQVLKWDDDATRSAVRVALTMNLSMMELQNQLVSQVTPMTSLQREQIRTHPIRAAFLLKECGVSDQEWINGVLQHHEKQDGSGYPFGSKELTDVARLVGCADIFTAKFSFRAGRSSVRSDTAVRQIFVNGRGDPIADALIKAFGLYPPGTAVVLKSGETALAIKVGETATAPIVMSLTNRQGDQLMTPIPRDTKVDEFAVVGAVPYASLRVRIPFDRLVGAYKG